MPYETPSAADLKARYPAFDAVADATVETWIANALLFVDEGWAEADYQPAILAHAAHNMTLLGLGSTTGTGAIPAGVTRFKSGAVDVTVSDTLASIQARGGYASSVYGREFQAFLRRNFGGPLVVAAGVAP